MSLKSILSPDQSVLVGLANGAIIIGIYQHLIPTTASIRTAEPHDRDIEGARKAAAWTSASVLGFMFLLTRDRNAFLIGGLVLGGVDFIVKHANGLNPATGRLSVPHKDTLSEDVSNVYPLPEYEDGAVGNAY